MRVAGYVLICALIAGSGWALQQWVDSFDWASALTVSLLGAIFFGLCTISTQLNELHEHIWITDQHKLGLKGNSSDTEMSCE